MGATPWKAPVLFVVSGCFALLLHEIWSLNPLTLYNPQRIITVMRIGYPVLPLLNAYSGIASIPAGETVPKNGVFCRSIVVNACILFSRKSPGYSGRSSNQKRWKNVGETEAETKKYRIVVVKTNMTNSKG